ncbi:hypothetical protein [Lihuaxuella thermophila]|uniref:Uncharacterized protein n=1 Tax=Lihuaxuella thermophila TaxID=1173111 RepID=A0A1H8BGA5_9BACL|nr:hypothetical protein [Lihuaxuella thermophila]SEM81812.1 hypothetical protein SAMN05444955_102168 [Lihuaxuella thermophila]
MQKHTFSVPYSVVEKLPAKERFLYYELCRLAAPRNYFDTEFKISVPKGGLISSTRRLSNIIDYSYSLTSELIDNLVEKKLIEMTPIDTGSKVPTFFMIQVFEVYAPSHS